MPLSPERPTASWLRERLDSSWGRGAIVAIIAFVSFAIYFPGGLPPDAAAQLAQAETGHLTDVHPPIMAALWRILLNVAPGPAPMLAMQVGLYWTGVWSLWDSVASEPKWRGLLPVIAAAHPLALVLLGAVLKDCALATALIAGFGFLFRRRKLHRRGSALETVIVALLFAYAGLVRWNGIFALPPLIFYWIAPNAVRPTRLIAGSVVLLALFAMLSTFVNHHLLRAAPTRVEASLQLFDMAGIEYHSGDRLLGLRPGCYTPFFWDTLNFARCGHLFERVTGASDFGEADASPGSLTGPWLRAIAAHPLAYAEHRLSYFNDSLYFLVPPAVLCRSVPDYPSCNRPPAGMALGDFIKKNLLYWPCVWLAAAAWLLLRTDAEPGVRALAWSGVWYALGYRIVGVATDWRYHFWTLLAISMAMALHVAQRGLGRRELREFALFVLPVVVAAYAARILSFPGG
jgi:hypothetical protein